MGSRGNKNKLLFLIFASAVMFSCLFFLFPFGARAIASGQSIKFYTDPNYDLKERDHLDAVLILETDNLYIYADAVWWNGFSEQVKKEIEENLTILGEEFKNNIYPVLTSNFGSEWKPGIDGDNRIAILFHPMKKGRAGYFNSRNEYSKLVIPSSNEREMVYLSADYILSPLIKSLLAHEFTHLITFNQKNRLRSAEEEIWLNEARAEYAPTLCGYDSDYRGSNLQKRVIQFLNFPSDSITEWTGTANDYGALNLFIQYLVEHYGVKILNDSLASDKTGIDSINYALSKNGFKEDFSRIFADWTVAVFLNDCSFGEKYCYKNSNLKSLRVIPKIDVLPFGLQNSALFVNYMTADWTGHWRKISGGTGKLSLEILGGPTLADKIPYVLCGKSNKCELGFLTLSENHYGKIEIQDFGKNHSYLAIIPFTEQSNDGGPRVISLSIRTEASGNADKTDDRAAIIQNILVQIEAIKIQIAELQAEINEKLAGISSCGRFVQDLYFGMKEEPQVSCLQEFLEGQGEEIYPEALVTGNFLTLTRNAVIRFQEKYASDILNPLGLSKGTGYVGEKTREKINQILGL